MAIPSFRTSPQDLFRKLWPQLDLVRRIGGVTFSGGEPLLQAAGIAALAGLCRQKGIHLCVETSGDVPARALSILDASVDCWLFGLRPGSEKQAKRHRAADLTTVRRNLAKLCRSGASRIIVRTPIIPGYTDGQESLLRVAEIMRDHGLQEIELLPFNPHAAHYYRALGLAYALSSTRKPSRSRLERIVRLFKQQGFHVRLVE